MIRFKNLIFFWLPIFLYCFLIFLQSSYPSYKSIPKLPHIDKLLHFIAYAFLGVLFLRAFKRAGFISNIKLIMIVSAIAACLFGISDEIHQSFVPYREAEIVDVLADVAGSICGVCFYNLFTTWCRDTNFSWIDKILQDRFSALILKSLEFLVIISMRNCDTSSFYEQNIKPI